jgi:Tol biopolymer transport system component
MKCLAKRPADRWQTADELLAQLEPLVTPSGGMTPAETRPYAAARRRMPAWALVSFLAGGLAVGVALFLIAGRHPAEVALGRRSQLTRDPGLEMDPVLSPDGKFVAYVTGTALATKVLVRPLSGGEAVMVSAGTGDFREPRWSPDGTRIAFSAPEGVQTVAALGGNPRLVPNAPYATFDWSPDGRRMAVIVGDTLWTQDLDGSHRTRVLDQPNIWGPSWSPDGRWIAFVSNNSEFVFGPIGNIAPSTIYVVPAAGGDAVKVTDSTSLNVSPVWWPKGHRLLYVSNRDGGRDLYRVDLGRSGSPADTATRLTTGLNAHTISLSATGDRLVYSAYSQSINVWSVPIPTREIALSSQAVPLTSGSQSVEQFAISPDGKWLAFDSDVSGNQDIWKMPIDGGTPQQLTSGPEDEFSPGWSPDGRELTFHSFKFGNRDVFVIPSAGGTPTPVAVTPAQDRNAEFTPDGQGIAFNSNREGEFHTYVTRRAGGAWGPPVLLFKNGRQGGSWSPDGRYVTAADSIRRYIFRAAAPDSEPVFTATRDSLVIEVGPFAWARDSRSYYTARRVRTLGWGVWQYTISPAGNRQVMQVDDPAADVRGLDVTATRLYFSVTRRESDIWTAEIATR